MDPGAGLRLPQARAMSRMARVASSQSVISLVAVMARYVGVPRRGGESKRCISSLIFVCLSQSSSRGEE